MALEFEQQTPGSINERMASDVKLSAPRSNPTRKNSFLFALVKGFAFRIYDLYQQLRRVKNESFPDTSTWDGELIRWGRYKTITPNPTIGAAGKVILTGTAGSTLPAGKTLTVGKVTYVTEIDGSIISQAFVLLSLSRNGDTVTAKTSAFHNLASALEVTITGANQAIFNGAFPISVVDSVTFTYQVDGDDSYQQATGLIRASFDVAFVGVKVAENSDVSGAASNQAAGTSIKLDQPAPGIDENAVVSFAGIVGGADMETKEQFYRRVIDAYQYPVAMFNPPAIRQKIKQAVATVTRVWVEACTPETGQVTIYFTTDNTGIIPTDQDVESVKSCVFGFKPSNTSGNDIFITAPSPKYVDFDFASISPNTVEMREAIRARLEELFYTSANVNKPLTSEVYRAKIQETTDSIGASVAQFALQAPIGDIEPATGEIPILRNVTFNDSTGVVYMDALFDGQNGNSDGATDGISQEITGSNQVVDLSVYGAFDGAMVTLQQFDTASSAWLDTSAAWTGADKLPGLNLMIGQRYRLKISGAGISTAISAEAYHG